MVKLRIGTMTLKLLKRSHDVAQHDGNCVAQVHGNQVAHIVGNRVAQILGNSTGVNSALTNSYDLLLMDVQMPRMDGHEATRELRRKGFTKPIIALTAHAMKEERDRAIASGFIDFLSKPVPREALIEMILKYK